VVITNLPIPRAHCQRNPDVGRCGKVETRGHHPYHAVGLGIQLELLSQNAAPSAETAQPKPVAEHDHVVRSRLPFTRREGPAELRLGAHYLKEIGRDAGATQTFRFRNSGQIHGRRDRCENPGEAMVVIPKVHVIARRQRKLGEASFQVSLLDHDELACLIKMQRLEQDRIDHRENRADRADT
jgi:hypothetical protein